MAVERLDGGLRYRVIPVNELDEALQVTAPRQGMDLVMGAPKRIGRNEAVIVSGTQGRDQIEKPLALVIDELEFRNLSVRHSHVRGVLTPFSSWCHVLTMDSFRQLKTDARFPDLNGTEAAWAGLILAETMLTFSKKPAGVHVQMCLGSSSFAVARSTALWPSVETHEINLRLEGVSRICRGSSAIADKKENRAEWVKSAFDPIWTTLRELVGINRVSNLISIGPLVECLDALIQARKEKDHREGDLIAIHLGSITGEAQDFVGLESRPPDYRLRLFDRMARQIQGARGEQKVVLAFLLGYLATVVAGGTASLNLAEEHSFRHPEIMGWACVVGGLGECVTWSSGFDGLGRLVVRELLRPFRLDDPPTCDFSFEEAAWLVDTALKDPLVHLHIKRARYANVSLLPGVVVPVPLSEVASPGQTNGVKAESAKDAVPAQLAGLQDHVHSDFAAMLAAHLYPYLKELSERDTKKRQSKSK